MVHISRLLQALDAAGVKVNLQVESAANPALLVGISQGGLQALVSPIAPAPSNNKLAVAWATAAKVGITAGTVIGISAADSVTPFPQTNLTGLTVPIGEALLTAPLGSAGTQLAQEGVSNELQVVLHKATTGIDPRKISPGIPQTQIATGAQPAPVASTTIATMTPGVAGTWQVYITIGLAGAFVSPNDANNFMYFKNAVLRGFLMAGVESGIVFGPFCESFVSTDTISIKNSNAGTAGSLYSATILATLMS